MPNDINLVTRGLPTPGGPTWVDRTFHWSFVGNTLTIPKSQCGQTDFIAKDHDQASWFNEHSATWLHGVWDCVWEWNTPSSRACFMAILAPLDPSHDEVARAVRKLHRAKAAGRAEAARALLALTRSNLTTAVPAIERVLRDADPELRALAAAVLYQWHRRIEPARLPALFRADDPVIRVAALQQAQGELYLDSYTRDQLPFIREGLADRVPAVRHQALQSFEAAAIQGLVSGRRVLELRAELGPLVGSDGLDRSDTLSKVADSRSPRTPSAPAMEAFYAELCEVELFRAQLEQTSGADSQAYTEACAQLASATDRARGLWERLPLAAPDEVRLYDTRIDILLSPELSAQLPDAEFVRRIAMSRSPRRELDAAVIYWVHQHTAPRGLPADYVRRAAMEARASRSDDPHTRANARRSDDPHTRAKAQRSDDWDSEISEWNNRID